MKQTKGAMIYVAIIIVSLFIIFFVGRRVDATNGTSQMIVTTNGINHFRKGMDVAGGVRLYYKIDLSKYRELYPNQQEFARVTSNVEDIILQNIDVRISKLGVSDHSLNIETLNDEKFVVVEIGGVHDLEQAKQTIGKTVELEFKTQYVGDGSEISSARQLVAENILKEAVASPTSLSQIALDNVGDEVYYQNYTDVSVRDLPQIYQSNADILASRVPGEVYPSLLQGVYGTSQPLAGGVGTPVNGWVVFRVTDKREGTSPDTGTGVVGGTGSIVDATYSLEEIFIPATPSRVSAKDPQTNEVLNGAFFRYANVSQSQTGQPVVIVNFDEKGKQIFCNITTQIVGQQMAIFVGGQLVTAPVIREQICGGSAQIDGQFTVETAKITVDELNEGALPAPLVLAHEEKVSASLGEKALQGALLAGGVGLLIVFVYMVYSYGWKRGVVALITLLSFLAVLFAVIKLIGFALSLSGIAAILLSLGMGVDANILIYERINEELDASKAVDQSIIDGYERSLSAIRDGNVTTGMIALLLFFMGTNVFKGFGTMMLVNIIITLSILVPFTKYCLLWIRGVSIGRE